MINFIIFFHTIHFMLSSLQFFLIAEILAFLTGCFVACSLIKNYIKQQHLAQQHNYVFYCLMTVIASTMIENFAWIFKLSNQFGFIHTNYIFVQIFNIAAWMFTFVRYQSLGLFLENLIENKFTFRWHQKLFFTINLLCMPILIYSVLAYIYQQPTALDLAIILRIIPFYFIISIIPSVIISFMKMREKNIPLILKKQLSIFLRYIIFPHILFDILQFIPFFGPQGAGANTAGIIGTLSLLFTTIAITFSSKNLIRFRLFNFSHKVEDPTNSTLTGDFKESITNVSLATTPQELIFITQTFFKENFGIPTENICLNFRYKQELCGNYCNTTNNTIETFITSTDQSIDLLRQYKILVADEIMFDAYYTTNNNLLKIAQFLNNIDSEIFLPMYDKNDIIAYLTIKRHAKHKFYSHAEQNKIVIFGTYLASAINIMHNNNTAALVLENKKIKEEIYTKHQEINQYKESVKTLLKQKSSNHVGILFYKEGRFTFGNEAAHNLLSINIHQYKHHPTSTAITKLAEQVSSFRTAQSCFIYDHQNKQLMVTAVPHLDYSSGVIITIHYPDTCDIIKTHIDKLQDPLYIDYLLYLQTTKSGKLINQLIPSDSESLLQFKVALLEMALHKKATLLQAHPDDLLAIVEIIHHISLRHTLHILDLKATVSTHDLSFKLFGVNPLLIPNHEEGLLKKLDLSGTLFIKNIDLLDMETQNKLADFIRYGIFTMCKSQHKITSDVRIICSTTQDAQTLVEQQKLSMTLVKELKATTLEMPSLLTMDEHELHELIDGVAHQNIPTTSFAHLLQICTKEKENLIDRRPVSLHEFKLKIQHLLTQKSKEYHIYQDTHLDPQLKITHPKILKAANLGKQALKDHDIMTLLWSEFGCQNKIAQLLGVNRSSVQRRCKEYNLM